MNETEKNLLTESRARLVVALRAFCESESMREPCLNLQDCDDCHVATRLEELKLEVIHSV